MMEISCDVTKDLLPGFLDETCSEESRKLVTNHLAGCPSCRAFLNQLKEGEKEGEKTAQKVDFLRGLRRNEQSWALFLFGMAATVALAAILTVRMGNASGLSVWRDYLVLVVLSLTSGHVLLSRSQKPEVTAASDRGSRLCLFGGGLLLLYYVLLLALSIAMIQAVSDGGAIPFGLEARQTGPFLGWNLRIVEIASLLLAGVAIWRGRAECGRWILALQLLWFDFTAALSLHGSLFTMIEARGWLALATGYPLGLLAASAVLWLICERMRRKRMGAV